MRRREREKHVTRLLPGYAERKLTPGGQARVERHLEGCKSCRQLLDRLQEARQALAAATPVSAPPTLWRRVEARLPVASPLQSETDDSSRRMKRRLKELSANRPKAEETVNTLAAWKSRLWPVRVLRWGWLGLVLGGVFLMTRFADDGERKKPSPGENTIVQASSAISWNVKRLRGTPRVGNATVADVARLKVGESLITGAKDSARIQIADIGQADVAPNSRLRLITTRNTQHRLALDRGELRAHVLAPPRLFLVDTPSAVAVDLGCAYTLNVDAAGNTRLAVTAGHVALEGGAQGVDVPAGAICLTRKGVGTGTPFFVNAPAKLKTAVQQFDFGDGGEAALTVLLKAARVEDTLTLFHLLPHTSLPQRERVITRLLDYVDFPEDVTRDGIRRLDTKMLAAWKARMEFFWY